MGCSQNGLMEYRLASAGRVGSGGAVLEISVGIRDSKSAETRRQDRIETCYCIMDKETPVG